MTQAFASPSRPSDSALIARTLAGDKEAFAEIVRKYQDRLFNTIVRIVGCPFEAEDILQDTLLQAFLKLNQFRGSAALYTWFYRLAVNQTLTRLRRRRTHCRWTASPWKGPGACGIQPNSPKTGWGG